MEGMEVCKRASDRVGVKASRHRRHGSIQACLWLVLEVPEVVRCVLLCISRYLAFIP